MSWRADVAKMTGHKFNPETITELGNLCWSQQQRERNQQKWLTDTFHSNLWCSATSATTLLVLNWAVLLCYVSKRQWTCQGHKVECDGQMHKNKNKTNKQSKIKHSTSYFPGTGKRHGLVVISGMALWEFRGNIEGYIVWISIWPHTQYFQLFSGSWNKTVQVPLMLCGENHRQQMSQVWCLRTTKEFAHIWLKYAINVSQRQKERLHLQTDIKLRLFWAKTPKHSPCHLHQLTHDPTGESDKLRPPNTL